MSLSSAALVATVTDDWLQQMNTMPPTHASSATQDQDMAEFAANPREQFFSVGGTLRRQITTGPVVAPFWARLAGYPDPTTSCLALTHFYMGALWR